MLQFSFLQRAIAYRFSFTSSCLIALLCTANAQTKLLSPNSPELYYQGRISRTADAAALTWSGSSVTVHFKGTAIAAILQDTDTANYYNVIVDGKEPFKIHTETSKKTYALATDLPDGNHTVQLFKRTEWTKGKTWFYGFEVPSSTKLLPPVAAPKRKIEFYGNSITCGYAIEDSSGNDSGKGYFENNYRSYAAVTARHFNAQYSCIARSGIGIMVSWFPQIMPEMYNLTEGGDSTSTWDFSQYTPDVVVVNLFQNDSWIVKLPKNKEFKHRFDTTAPSEKTIIESYRNFVKTIRSKYPKARIICALGSMDATKKGSPWPGYVERAVQQLHDLKIYTLFFDYKGTAGHPNVAEQQIMANSLIGFIKKKIKW